MSFAQPIAFVLSALALPIIAFYILKIRLRRVPVSTNLFWRQIYDEKPPRSIPEKLRHLLSLLAQLLVLLLLVLAAADPYFSDQRLRSRRIVLIVDSSASMRTADVRPSRFDAARTAAHDVISSLRHGDEVAVILAGSRPDVVEGLTSHAPTLRRTVDGLSPTDSPADLAAAVSLGQRLIGSDPQGQVIVLTDGCTQVSPQLASSPALSPVASTPPVAPSPDAPSPDAPSPDAPSPDAPSPDAPSPGSSSPTLSVPTVTFRCFGTPAANIGITQFQSRRSHADPLGYEILVGVRNAAPNAVQCRLELSLNDLPVDIIPLTLQPEELWSRAIEKTSTSGGRLMASLTQIRPAVPESLGSDDLRETRTSPHSDLNGLALDDTAWSILPAREIRNVLVVTSGNLFLQKVFEANPLVSLRMQPDFPAVWPDDTVIVLHRDVPATLPPGPVIVVDPIAGCDQWDAGDVIQNPIVTEQDSDSPLMTHIRLDNVLMQEARSLRFRAPPQILAGTLTGEPVYAAVQRPAGKCLVLSVSLDRSDLAFRTAFPIMMTNALAWFAGQQDELEQALSSGSLATISTAADAAAAGESIVVRSPSGRVIPVAAGAMNSPAAVLPAAVLPAAVLPAAVLPANSGSAAQAHAAGSSAPADASDSTSVTATDRDTENGQQNGNAVAVGTPSVPQVARIGPLDEAGIWSAFRTSSGSSRDLLEIPENAVLTVEVAVNLASASETDLRPFLTSSRSERQPGLSRWFVRPLWFYLVLTVSGLLMLEWVLYQRRLIT